MSSSLWNIETPHRMVLMRVFTPACLSCPQNSTTNKYHLSGISLLANWSDMAGTSQAYVLFSAYWVQRTEFLQRDAPVCPAPFSASNTSLDYLRSTLGHSYMCNAEQSLVVTPSFSVNTFKLQVQPFGVTTNQFATGTIWVLLLLYLCCCC